MINYIRSLFKKQQEEPIVAWVDTQLPTNEPAPVDFSCFISEEEKELVSVIASSIAAGNQLDSKYRVLDVMKIDTDKEIAVAIVSAILAGDQPNATVRLRSITEVTKKEIERNYEC